MGTKCENVYTLCASMSTQRYACVKYIYKTYNIQWDYMTLTRVF